MQDNLTSRPAGTWRLWTVCLPGMLAITASGLYIVADGYAAVMGSWDTPVPGLWWSLKVAVIGHCVLAVASIIALRAGLIRPAWRPATAVVAWMIIPAGFAWLVLAWRLPSGL